MRKNSSLEESIKQKTWKMMLFLSITAVIVLFVGLVDLAIDSENNEKEMSQEEIDGYLEMASDVPLDLIERQLGDRP